VSQLVDVLMPEQHEGTKATILRWCRKVGERVTQNEPLVEVETDKVTVEIPSPASGELVDILKAPNDAVEPNSVLARVRSGDAAAKTGGESPGVSARRGPGTATSIASGATAEETAGADSDSDSASASGAGPSGLPINMPLSPAVRRLLAEHGIDASQIAGTGRDRRITAQDILQHVERMTAKRAGAAARSPVAASTVSQKIPHSAIRRRIAEHMVQSMATAPHVTTLFEADLSRVSAHKKSHEAAFAQRGAKLTLTSYFVAASVRALQAVPQVNATFHADHLEIHGDCNVGVGTALGTEGLIVPVVHKAQTLDLFGISKQLGDLVAAARAGKLAPESVRGGTFTISNHGVSGSILAAPIVIYQPQVAILGVGKVERRVVVHEIDGEDVIRVRPMCYVTLTLDHRAIDAFQANAFLAALVRTLEEWQ